MEDHLESVHTLTSRFEADLLMDALEREQIPALLRSFEETPYDGLCDAARLGSDSGPRNAYPGGQRDH